MPARDMSPDVDQELGGPEQAAPEVMPEAEIAEPEQMFSPEGELPEVAEQQQAAAAPAQSASDLAFQPAAPVAATNNPKVLDAGMHTPEEYKAACEASGTPDRWQAEFHYGHTSAKGFTQPYHRRGGMFNFELETGNSASKAIQDFIKGPTVVDFDVMAVAAELDGVRKELGDEKFDKLFGSANMSEDTNIPSTHRLRISPSMFALPFADEMRTVARDYDVMERSRIADSKPMDTDGPPADVPAAKDKAKVASLDENLAPGLLEEQDPEQLQEMV